MSGFLRTPLQGLRLELESKGESREVGGKEGEEEGWTWDFGSRWRWCIWSFWGIGRVGWRRRGMIGLEWGEVGDGDGWVRWWDGLGLRGWRVRRDR